MTKKNVEEMKEIKEMEKVSGGVIYDPDKPYPTNLPPGSLASTRDDRFPISDPFIS